jgi:enterochelin esterase family protein
MLDTLLANERAVPMIIVMLDGEAGSRPTLREQGNVNTEALGKDLMGNLVPFVNDLYRVRKKAADRALFGVSRGGGQSLMIGLMHRDTFGRVGGLSSVIMEQKETVERALARGSKTDLDPKPLWLYCGASERFIAKHNEEFCHLLREHGIRYEYTLSEGSHGWPLWRPQFAQLVQRMFI